jgi:hypothetical protein
MEDSWLLKIIALIMHYVNQILGETNRKENVKANKKIIYFI